MSKKKSKTSSRRKDESQLADTNGERIDYVSISQETRRRYLNYAHSVIQSRALPDVRDGLKPVQRRILYVMFHDLRLMPDAKRRKCAKIKGDTTGNYHPHGDTAVYDALVRLAQDHTYRYPLIDGQGNFGSVMGLPPAADRYTEARLTKVSAELMSELRYQTVDMRPNYEATREEPVVLPARFPSLLANGSQGIAVGMATNIPPHNLTELIKGCVHLIKHPNATVAQIMKYIKGPDFPMGGRIVTDHTAIRKIYESGRGPIKVRGCWREDKIRSKPVPDQIVIYAIPYGVDTGTLATEIGSLIGSRKLPQLTDVTDETSSTNGIRIVVEMKPGADPEAVIAYLYKHTSFEQNFAYNATCLIPDENGVLSPARISLVEMLRYFLEFRFKTVRRRFEFQLQQLEKRIHILNGFAIVFKGIDRALKIIRASDGKQDAAKKLMKAFPLDEVQTNAILELQLYRISKLEIDTILEELKEKKTAANRIRRILKSDKKIWDVVQKELLEIAEEFGNRRRTSLGSSEEITEFDAQSYIVRENTNVVVTCDGWIKRVGRLTKVTSTRVRDGDSVLDVVPGSTLDNVIVFAGDGVAHTLPINEIPVSSGYGEPLSKHVRLADGMGIVATITTDPRFTPKDKKRRREDALRPHLLIVTAHGQVMRISLSSFRTHSTKTGRKFCRLRKSDRVVFTELISDAETMFVATKHARLIHFPISDAVFLGSAGIGVRGIKLSPGDEVLGAVQLSRPSDCLRVRNTNDKVVSFGQLKYSVTSRGGKGVRTSHRNGFDSIIRRPIDLVDWNEMEEE